MIQHFAWLTGWQEEVRTAAPSSSSPTCGSAISCAAIRCVKLLRERFPDRPVDMLATTLCAPLADYMPGVRQAVIVDLPRKRLALAQQGMLARRLKREGYGTALIMPRTWKSALAPFLAGIPERTGFVGEARFVLLNDLRFGERKLPRMVDRCAALALPRGAKLPAGWPAPELSVPAAEVAAWRGNRGLAADGRPVVALAPGAVGPSKRWPAAGYAALTRRLLADGLAVWVLGGPGEKSLAQEIVGATAARDLTGPDLRDAILALAAASAAVSNDSGLLHVAAALGTPTDRNFRPDQPVALGAAQSARRNACETKQRTRLPALPQAGMPARPSSLHARHQPRTTSSLPPAARLRRSPVAR